MWIGTYVDGLVVYDQQKRTLKNYSNNPDDANSISSNRITCIKQDKDNQVWIGTNNGLNLLINERFSHFYHDPQKYNSINNNAITALEVDPFGRIWVGTQGGGLNMVTKENDGFLISRYTSNSKFGRISNDYILSLFADNNGYLWIGTDNGGLNRLNIPMGIVDVYQSEDGYNNTINSNSIWSLFGDDEDRIWIGTYNRGINVIDKNSENLNFTRD
ncbi:MAG: hypothetical protein HC906_13470 [Bacteroidales bacterium]|nr:hypothetical protein [Bacteroidales bacterium]